MIIHQIYIKIEKRVKTRPKLVGMRGCSDKEGSSEEDRGSENEGDSEKDDSHSRKGKRFRKRRVRFIVADSESISDF